MLPVVKACVRGHGAVDVLASAIGCTRRVYAKGPMYDLVSTEVEKDSRD